MSLYAIDPFNFPVKRSWRTIKGFRKKFMLGSLGILYFLLLVPSSWAQNTGIGDKSITVGSLLPLEGDRKESGLAIKAGLEAAFASQSIQGRRIELAVSNDFYDPAKAVEAAKKLIDRGIFLMVGNHGTPTVKATLPVLAESKIPLLGPYTGAALTGPGDVLNFRTSYVKEVQSVIDIALAAGIKPGELCAYVQNDSYGMSGLQGMRLALANQPSAAPLVATLEEIINKPGDNPARNDVGPIGVYQRDTLVARNGYQSLKKWEEANKTRCRLVVTVGVFDAVSQFIIYARSKDEPWAFSMVSFTGTPVKGRFKELGMTGKIIQTQVVPPLDSPLGIVEEARKTLGQNLSYPALEGYIVGKLLLAIALAGDGPLSREGFLKAARRQVYDVGGLKVDFTNGKNPGSELVFLSYLKDDTAFASAKPGDLETMLKP